MSENAKLTEQELNDVKTLLALINKGQNAIGGLELEKAKIIGEIKEVETKLEEARMAIEEKYGSIQINLETGEYTVVDSENEQ